MTAPRGTPHPLAGGLAANTQLSFRAVNRKGSADYQAGLQRHHLLPRQLVNRRCFGRFLDCLGRDRVGLHDFRANGLLLPSNSGEALRTGLPLHRGPHRLYSELVIERIGQIEQGWVNARACNADRATLEALMRMKLLQRALRKKLLQNNAGKALLNRHDPLGNGSDFTDLDAMADAIWGVTAPLEA